MTPRTLSSIGLCAVLVPVVSAVPPAIDPFVLSPASPAFGAVATVEATQAAAPEVPVRSTRIERRDAASGLPAAIAAVQAADAGPLWFAWSVPAVAPREGKRARWGDGEIGRCVLEDDGDIRHDQTSGITSGTRRVVVLARSEGRRLTRVTFADERCTVDAGSRPVYWLTSVAPAQSVSLLAGVVRDSGSADGEKGGRHALPALALHADPSADAALASFVAPDQRRELRRDAAFWLGAARGTAGAAVIERLARDDKDDNFREHLTFVLTLTGDRGLDVLVDLAKHDSSTKVRGQALFWLGQKAGQRAVQTLDAAVTDDPDREVRKKAVFALSQLPKDEGVPKLIALARTHRDPEVRKQAMFWLGQSGDARAVQFFEEVLKH
jgi:HEAT repeat protein